MGEYLAQMQCFVDQYGHFMSHVIGVHVHADFVSCKCSSFHFKLNVVLGMCVSNCVCDLPSYLHRMRCRVHL